MGDRPDLVEIGDLLRKQDPRLLEEPCARLLDAVARDRHLVEPLLHPLGFVYAPLARWPHATLRLHLWPPVAQRRHLTADEVSPMHDHTWDLVSYIAHGALENVEVSVVEVDEPSDADFRVFTIYGEGVVDRVVPTQTLVRIEAERKMRHFARSIYTMPADVVHRSEASGDPTVTLVLALRTERQTERALGALDLPAYTTRRQAFPRDEFTKAIRDIFLEN
jgi:hypothetical protein